MISEIELKKAILDLLKTKYPSESYKYYGIEVSEGCKRPSFFVDMRLEKEQDATANLIKKEYAVYITYFAEKVNETDNLKKVEEIRQLLRCTDNKKRKRDMTIKVKERYIKIENYHYGYTGEANNILQIMFDFSFLEFEPETERAMLMRSVEITGGE